MARTLIRNGMIVTVDPGLGVIAGGDLLIEDDRIAAIGRNIDASDARHIDASGMIVMPGLINAHIHTWQTVLRGIGAAWASDDYFELVHGILAPCFTPHDMYISTLRSHIEAMGGELEVIARFPEGTVRISNFAELGEEKSN